MEKYLASDLVCYRASSPRGLVERQARHWDPILDWAREALDADFALGEGVVYVAQPQAALAAARAAIPTDPWRLGAVHAATTLTGSALLALALANGRLTVEEAWQAAHVDEDWNMEQWGRDEAALERRAFRFAEMQAAATVLRGPVGRIERRESPSNHVAKSNVADIATRSCALVTNWRYEDSKRISLVEAELSGRS